MWKPVLRRIEEAKKWIKEKVSSYRSYRKKAVIEIASKRPNCFVAINPGFIIIVMVEKREDQKPILKLCEILLYANPGKIVSTLSEFVSKHELESALCTLVLPPVYYQTYPIDFLPVPKDEMREALKWYVSDLIDYPLDEAVIDYFQLSKSQGDDKSPMIYIFVAHLNFLQNFARIIQSVDLTLQAITIYEMGIRSLIRYFYSDVENIGFIIIKEFKAEMLFFRDSNLYFARTVELRDEKRAMDETMKEYYGEEGFINGLAFEIRRSIEYYKNRFRLPGPDKLIVYSPNKDAIVPLSENIGILVEEFDLSKVFDMETSTAKLPGDDYYADCLPVIGYSLTM